MMGYHCYANYYLGRFLRNGLRISIKKSLGDSPRRGWGRGEEIPSHDVAAFDTQSPFVETLSRVKQGKEGEGEREIAHEPPTGGPHGRYLSPISMGCSKASVNCKKDHVTTHLLNYNVLYCSYFKATNLVLFLQNASKEIIDKFIFFNFYTSA